ncbi:hydroxyacylglutathione hydrolase [Sulfurivermis fontis]|jgi:hydroxyacylglutathione hydrolase|uniref:hydroxyacylglutathione hydrolase n=1 Tax=Sulfurivermis fontis TaxID=1972068 RepID=UPI000FD96D5C|nr:hydroxyacylglutathione hydrolase [Sulfurivermis fontis]
MLEVRCVPAFDDNYIWLPGLPGSRRVAIVDPGDAEPVLAYLSTHGLEPAAILVTHHHGDHTGGICDLTARYDIPVYGPARERIPGMTHPVSDGERLELEALGLEFEVMETPGHTRGHVCYLGHGALFCGDTLFTAGCGRLFEGTPQQMHASLSRIAALPQATLIYCAHEYTATNLRFARVVEPDNPDILARIDEVARRRARHEATVPAPLLQELKTNPFLRCGVPEVVTAAEGFAGHALPDGASVFATVRHWKDTLD